MRMMIAAALLAAGSAPALAGSYTTSVIATGLNNPRGLAVGPDGAIYVAEAGIASPTGPSAIVRGTVFRYAETASITRITGGSQARILEGLPSFGSVSSGETSGPQDIAFDADGIGYVLFGLGTDPAVRFNELGSAAGAANLGRLMTFTPGGIASYADVAAYEGANNPAGGPIDSNPFRMVASPDGMIVTDAGANAFFRVGADSVELLATFPGRDIGGGFPSDSVTTGVAIGPDGAWYLGELTGFPFTPGSARIYRVEEGGSPEILYTGFTQITDIAFGPDGSLFVLELDSNSMIIPGGSGQLTRIRPNGSRSLVLDGLVMPTGLAVGSDGTIYVSNFSAMAGIGQVLAIAYVPEPASWAMMMAGFGAIGLAARRRRRGPVIEAR